MAAAAAEATDTNWDEDFDGDFSSFAPNASVGTTYTQTSISSRLSVHSESVAADDDWNVVLQPNDERATDKALQAAQQAGIPLPQNIPSSALLGGTIKRLGKKKSRQKVRDEWDGDLEMGDDSAPLTLKLPKAPQPEDEEFDDFDELEGSLGIRFAGKSQTRNRSSSASAMSPSVGSVTAESEDDFGGLELPEGPMDFGKILEKRKATEAELSDLSQPSPAIEQPATMNTHKKSKLLSDDNDDFLNDFDLGGGDILNNRKTRLNKNLKIKDSRPPPPAQRPATTINFHDKPTDKPIHMRSHLPRPVSGSRPSGSRLEPVFESGASHIPRERRHPTTTGAQLLKSKRSMPAIGTQRSAAAAHKPSFIPAGGPSYQSPHVGAHRAMPYHLRRDSDPHNRQGAQSPPPPRPHSRLSNAFTPDTPSRTATRAERRAHVAPPSLVGEAARVKNMTRPTVKKTFGDGHELDAFDDLQPDMAKESKFVKEPTSRGVPRKTQSRADMRAPMNRATAIPERMMTPAPPRTPASPTKGFYEHKHTPSYLRDTAASRIARETRLQNNPRPRSQGPLQPITNWQQQIAARSPHSSPSAQRPKSRKTQPNLIKPVAPGVAKSEWLHQAETKSVTYKFATAEKGMTYNPHTLRWEGNENIIDHFDIPPPLQTPTPAGHGQKTSYMDGFTPGPPISPPRPALIAHVSQATQGVQVNGGMVFDPRQMKWLKLKEGRDVSGPLSPSVTDNDEEEDAFAGIEDLKDEAAPALGTLGTGSVGGMASPVSMAAAGVGEVHEEFDLGPQFIRLQRDAEAVWRTRCGGWFSQNNEPRVDDGRWRWTIRNIVQENEISGVRPAS